ncbi:MAG: hypothetical protein K0U41_08870 [Gammaproteobacteria bacterium]|nr:hypothetical protein [Gammaproteobacteria bacterium]
MEHHEQDEKRDKKPGYQLSSNTQNGQTIAPPTNPFIIYQCYLNSVTSINDRY